MALMDNFLKKTQNKATSQYLMFKILYSVEVYTFFFISWSQHIYSSCPTNIRVFAECQITHRLHYYLHFTPILALCSTSGLVYKMSITSSSDANVT